MNLDDTQRSEVIGRYRSAQSGPQIAAETGIPIHLIYPLLRSAGVAVRRPGPRPGAPWPELSSAEAIREFYPRLSITEFAARIGVSRPTVTAALLRHGVPIAAKRRPALTASAVKARTGSMATANTDRSRGAAGRTVEAAKRRLDTGGFGLTQEEALRLRVDFPEATLRELGDKAGLTKDAYAGILRRALADGGEEQRPHSGPDPRMPA